ncbi:hypothetical protein BZA77DRAFT_304278 [Pyronema omphalodes]|nr:hypothetical protein BZA77DRAFT_304278 [Pyronema omphalodes]
MAPQQFKDKRSAELIIPYTPAEYNPEEQTIANTMSNALPMAAMFTRNKMVGWTAVVFAIQSWMSESSDSLASGKQPGIFAVGISLMSLAVTYIPVFFPTMPAGPGATGTDAPAPQAA